MAFGKQIFIKINMLLEQETRAQFMEEETTLSEHSMLRGNAKRNYPVVGFKPISVLRRS